MILDIIKYQSNFGPSGFQDGIETAKSECCFVERPSKNSVLTVEICMEKIETFFSRGMSFKKINTTITFWYSWPIRLLIPETKPRKIW